MRIPSRSIAAGLAAAVCLAVGTLAEAQMSPATKCEAGKGQEAGKYAACQHKAEVRLVKTRGACSDDPGQRCYRAADCVSPSASCDKDATKYDAAVIKCRDKFNAKWNKLEDKAGSGVCPDGLLASELRDEIDACVANVTTLLAGGVAPTPRYVDNGDGSITDHETGLVWEKKVSLGGGEDYDNLNDADNFHIWAGTCSLDPSKLCQPNAAASAACFAGVQGAPVGCDECGGGEGTCELGGPDETTAWEWLAALNASSFAGASDWRLPTRFELGTILDFEAATAPAVDSALHGPDCGAACLDLADPGCACTKSDFYWSATTYAFGHSDVWMVGLGFGTTTTVPKSSPSYVRAVRSGS